MNKKFLLVIALTASLFISCGDDDTSNIIVNVTEGGAVVAPDSGNIELSGNFSESLTLDASKTYIITGPTIFESGTTLTIPAGTTISAAATGADVYLAIAQGAKIDAQGTSNQPIVFTSSAVAQNSGDWGGLIILGNAPINSVDGIANTTATSEIASLPYGGTDAADDSGSLSYIRIEYSGGKADGQSENNGLSLYGVGNGTTINNIQIFKGADDGVEFFGGTVNASFISVLDCEDDSVDWTEGYTGTLTDVHIQHGTSHDKGIEADGFNTDVANNGGFFSNPTVNNLTIVGLGSSTGNEAVRLRAGTRANFTNVLIQGFDEGFDLDDEETGNGVASGMSVVNSVTFEDVTTNLKNDTTVIFTEADFLTENTTSTGTDFATWGAGWTRQ